MCTNVNECSKLFFENEKSVVSFKIINTTQLFLLKKM